LPDKDPVHPFNKMCATAAKRARYTVNSDEDEEHDWKRTVEQQLCSLQRQCQSLWTISNKLYAENQELKKINATLMELRHELHQSTNNVVAQ